MAGGSTHELGRWGVVWAGGLVLLLGWHTAHKLGSGLLPEMLWACHLASAFAAVALLVGWSRGAAAAAVFHLANGLPAWLVEVLTVGTTWTSVGLHLGTSALILPLWRSVPGWTPLFALGLWSLGVMLGRLVDPGLNVNIAWRPYPGLLPHDSPLWWSHVGNILLIGLCSGLVSVVLRRAAGPARGLRGLA